jgi:hypothetical protein
MGNSVILTIRTKKNLLIKLVTVLAIKTYEGVEVHSLSSLKWY